MKHYIYSLLAIPLMMFCNACETTEKIDDFPLRPSSLVSNCYFASDSTWEIQVSRSLSVLDNAELTNITNAEISIYNDDLLLDVLKEPDPDGIYRSQLNTPLEGENYSIKVKSPDYEKTLEASDYVPQRVPITNVTVSIIDSSFYRDPYVENEYAYGNAKGTINIEFTDPDNEENYYELIIYQVNTYYNYYDGSLEYNRYKLSFTSEDPIADINSDYNTILYFSDEIINGQQYKMKINFDNYDFSMMTKFDVQFKSLSRSGYLYRKSVSKYEETSQDPFSEPVKIYSNIQNGFGIFAGYSVSNFILPIFIAPEEE